MADEKKSDGKAPAEDPNKGNNEAGDFSGIAKVLSGAVATVIAAAATVGAATGSFAYLYRNEPLLVLVGLTLGVLAAAVAMFVASLPENGKLDSDWRRRIGVFLLSFVLLVGGLCAIVLAQAETQDIAARPTLNTDWTMVESEWMLKVSAEVKFLRRDEILHVLVQGFPVVDGRLGEPATVFRSFTGPNEDGTATQAQTVDMINVPNLFTAIQVLAVVMDLNDPREPRMDLCNQSPSPQQRSELRRVQVACVYHFSMPPLATPGPSTTPSPTPAPTG